MTNNLEVYKEYIKEMSPDFPQKKITGNEDKFYVIEIMHRGKDNPNMPAANYHFKNYYIYCWDDFDRYMPEIKLICTTLRMRAYASVNWKSTKQIAMNTIAAMAKRAADGDFKKIYSEWSSQTGLYSVRNENVWLLDIDDVQAHNIGDNGSEKLFSLYNMINACRSQFDKNVIKIIPTRSGSHILTRPFDVKEFAKRLYNDWMFSENSNSAWSAIVELHEVLPTNLNETDTIEWILNWLNVHFIKKNHVTLLYENL